MIVACVKHENLESKLRVAIVAESFLPQVNGVTNSVLRVLDFLKKNSHEAIILAPDSNGSPVEYAGFEILPIPAVNFKGLIPLALPQQLAKAKLIEFNPELKAIDVDIPQSVTLVIANSLTPSPKLLTVGTRYNKRVVECRFGLLIISLKLGLAETYD